MDYRDRITIEPGKRSGKPCIRGLRITVYDVLGYLGAGMTVEEVLADFPDLERDDVLAALQFAADRERATWTVAAVRALFDHNLSPRLVGRLLDLFPGSTHVRAWGWSAPTTRGCGATHARTAW